MAGTGAGSGTVLNLVRERVLTDMLGSVKDPAKWKVLITDSFTTQVVSSMLGYSEIIDKDVSLVEHLNKQREPLSLAAVYFIQPDPITVRRLCQDFEGKPLYPSVHIFLSSACPSESAGLIRNCKALKDRLKTFKELDLEFITVDPRCYVTNNTQALVKLMGEKCGTHHGDVQAELSVIARRLATFFDTIKECPSIRYRSGGPADPSDPPGQEVRSLLCQRLASELTNRVSQLQKDGSIPAQETCDLLILDRSFDPVAPVIHEWTYEALVYDRFQLQSNEFELTGSEDKKKRMITLNETDPLWLEYRHQHLSSTMVGLSSKLTEMKSSKVARYEDQRAKDPKSDLPPQLLPSLAQYQDNKAKLGRHLDITQELLKLSNQEAGQLEHDIVFGRAGQKELLQLFNEKGDTLHPTDKLRMLWCYVATHLPKMDATTLGQWQAQAKLDAAAMDTLKTLAYLSVPIGRTQGGGVLNFGRGKEKRIQKPRRTSDRHTDEYDPLLLEIVDNFVAQRLPQNEYPYVRAPEDNDGVDAARSAFSARTNRPGLKWGNRQSGGGGGRKVVIFVIGGVSRGEMRCVHQTAKTSGRDVLLLSTSVEIPKGFLEKMYTVGQG